MFIYDVQRKQPRELMWMLGQINDVMPILDKINEQITGCRKKNWEVNEPLGKIQRELARQYQQLHDLRSEIEREFENRKGKN